MLPLLLAIATATEPWHTVIDRPREDRSTTSFATTLQVGDFDADGYDDLVVGEQSVVRGALHVYLGSDLGLSTVPHQSWMGTTGSSRLGSTFAVCDLNGDGFDDLIAGAYGTGPDVFTQNGEVLVFYGGSAGLAVTPDVILTGSNNSALGSRVTCGDVNGDGRDDVLARDRTSVGLWLGGVGALDSTRDQTWVQPSSRRAWPLVADINGDGFGDVVLMYNAPFPDTDDLVHIDLGAAAGPDGALDQDEVFDDSLLTSGDNFHVADVDHDGDDDLFTPSTEATDARIRLWRGTPMGLMGFEETTLSSRAGTMAVLPDLDGDGEFEYALGLSSSDWNLNESTGAVSVYGGSSDGPTVEWSRVQTGRYRSTFGWGLTTGDFDGDGVVELAAGSTGELAAPDVLGRVYVWDATWVDVISPAASIVDDDADVGFGTSAEMVGDVDQDGFQDLLVGAPGFDGIEEDGGAAYLFRGSVSGFEPEPFWSAFGTYEDGQLGGAVANVGDLNGDGFDDLAVGEWGSNRGEGILQGALFVYYGGPQGPSTVADEVLQGAAVGSRFGRAVSAGGDMNGDGIDDMVVLAGGDLQRVHIVYGRTGADPFIIETIDETDRWFSTGLTRFEPLGDVDGDGYDDVAAAGDDYFAARIAVLYGGPAGVSFERLEDAEHGYGIHVLSAGDVNGDGSVDLLVGAHLDEQFSWQEEGMVDLFLGGPNGLNPEHDRRWSGQATKDFLGLCGGIVGDVNGDACDDVLLCASGGIQPGVAGSPTLKMYNGSLGGGTEDLSWTGPWYVHPTSVVPLGDHDNDGFDDVAVVAENCWSTDELGCVYVFYGSPGGLQPPCADRLACPSEVIADRDGDGRPDIEDDVPDDAARCGDRDADGCDDCSNGRDDLLNDGVDTDGDGVCDLTDDDDDDDGIVDGDDEAPGDAQRCRDVDGDGCDDCALTRADPAFDGPDLDRDGLCDVGDLDDDGDGVADLDDDFPQDPSRCGDGNGDTCDDCAPFDDLDADGLCDAGDADADGDGMPNVDDTAPLDPFRCGDEDADSCDDCTLGTRAAEADGADLDGDGACDLGDLDDDGDSVDDGIDPYPRRPDLCGDRDGDGCDDCRDSADVDLDGLCDAADDDDDGDGREDGQDPWPLDATRCGDVDLDTCDDCALGKADPAVDGDDLDADGLCDPGDPDDDGDGVPDVVDVAPTDAEQCSDIDGDGCEDCISGVQDPANDGPDADGDGLCDDGDADADGDGFVDGATYATPTPATADPGDDGDSEEGCGCGHGGSPGLLALLPLFLAWRRRSVLLLGVAACTGDGKDPIVPDTVIDTDPCPMAVHDQDNDGYVDGSVEACAATLSVSQLDCDDSNADVRPGAPEIPCNGIDDDCEGATWDDPDGDGDGVGVCSDCDDNDAAVAPGFLEVSCNEIDDDCDGSTVDRPDVDRDGVDACTDCLDLDAAVYPGAEEVLCNAVDDDCDASTVDAPDGDGDGASFCEDCDDADAARSPGLSEVTCNGIDDDCWSLTVDAPDGDLDGSDVCTDCDDLDARRYPGAAERLCSGVDEDCDAITVDADGDGDGYDLCIDCDDTRADVHPQGIEIACNNLDDDCDPSTPDSTDGDGDGVVSCLDCDDADPTVNPMQTEEPCNGVDDDCQPGTLDRPDGDGDGVDRCEDCLDIDPLVGPHRVEVSCNGLDDDCNAATLDLDDTCEVELPSHGVDTGEPVVEPLTLLDPPFLGVTPFASIGTYPPTVAGFEFHGDALLMGGTVRGPLHFVVPPAVTINSTLPEIGFVVELGANLSLARWWSFTRRGASETDLTGMVVGDDGGIYVTGRFDTEVSFQFGEPEERTFIDPAVIDEQALYLARIDPDGSLAWLEVIDASGFATSTVSLASDGVVLRLYSQGPAYVRPAAADQRELTPAPGDATLQALVHWTPAGDPTWSVQVSSPGLTQLGDPVFRGDQMVFTQSADVSWNVRRDDGQGGVSSMPMTGPALMVGEGPAEVWTRQFAGGASAGGVWWDEANVRSMGGTAAIPGAVLNVGEPDEVRLDGADEVRGPWLAEWDEGGGLGQVVPMTTGISVYGIAPRANDLVFAAGRWAPLDIELLPASPQRVELRSGTADIFSFDRDFVPLWYATVVAPASGLITVHEEELKVIRLSNSARTFEYMGGAPDGISVPVLRDSIVLESWGTVTRP